MDELSPKELYEQKKKEKFSTEIKKERSKIFRKISILLIIVFIVFGGIYWLVKRSQKEGASKKIYAVQIADQGRDHISVGQTHPEYNSNPPTSGWHYEDWETKGVYKEQQPDEGLVHNLEHGYIWISYRPDAGAEIIKQLENFYGFGKKIVVEPRKENDKLVALAAWNWLDKFDPVRSRPAGGMTTATSGRPASNGVDPESKESLNGEELKRVQDFIDAYINQGPEPNAP